MEAAALGGLFKPLVDKISNFTSSGISNIIDIDKKIEKFDSMLVRVVELVHYLNSRQLTGGMWEIWLRQLVDTIYDAEDVMDQCFILSLKSNPIDEEHHLRNKIISERKFKLPGKIVKLSEKLEEVAKKFDSPIIIDMITSQRQWEFQTSSIVDRSSIIGRDKEKQDMINLLCTVNAAKEGVDVIPIVGISGLGKTLLAQMIYNDTTIEEKFDLRIWASMSTSSSVMEVMKSIIESATKTSATLSNLDAVQRRLCEIVKNKKVFLVLDDMWVESHNYWDDLKLPFAYAGAESKILVTTQSTIVSSIVATSSAYNLASLSDEECQEIIMQKAFSTRNLCGMENLVEIGKEIAKKCYGIPLVAKTLGCVLQQRLKEKQWHEVLECEIWELAQVKTEVFPTLKLGFDRLSPHLRRCFLYCSIFHSNYVFEKENLVQMWVAEGLVVQEKTRAIWDVGRDYFDDLLGRSFFYASDLVGYRQQYKMHGLLHRLAEFISSDLCFRVEDTMMETKLLGKHKHARHSSLTCSELFQPSSLEPFHKFKRLRTFMSDGLQGEIVHSGFFGKLKRLRTLHFRGLGMTFIPDAFEHLIHLRYFDASYSRIEKLPRGFANIIGLQTIKLKGCENLTSLPKNMKKLIELQHLELGSDTQLLFMPPEFGKLKQLETLDAFVVGDKRGSSIAELENLNNIKGDLSIIGLENVSKKEEAETAKLSEKLHLENLQLQWNQASNRQFQFEVLNILQPHMGLKRLTIKNYGHLGFPNWLADPSFSSLIEVQLMNCQNCAFLPLLGQLPALEILFISEMHELEEIDSTFCGFGVSRGFMSLKSLKLSDMPKLERWEGLQSTDMPFLLKLVIQRCPLLKVLPPLQYLSSLETLNFAGCTHLQSLPEGPLPNMVKYFEITECDLLKESCSEDGSDWMKIRHIPRIVIDK